MSIPPFTGIRVWSVKELHDPHVLPGLARRELLKWMGREHPALPDLQLIASELVTNALLHARATWVRMSLTPSPDHWELTVTDPGLADSIPIPRCPDVDEKHGRGLWVIDDLTLGRWDTSRGLAGDRIVRAFLPR
ncbi:ATP-binding protein [Nonomuraea sp. NPDC049714]|uniref:ATP-binding protein n=1 Tax=Nonomuraea sp. NPDC049714 TaxID=3364357 RepID=UPI0037B6A7BF